MKSDSFELDFDITRNYEKIRLQKLKEEEMNYMQRSDILSHSEPALSLNKFVVITTTGRVVTTFAAEEEAVSFCKRYVKAENDTRLVILEAKKEIGTKQPEVEVEDL